MAAEFDVMDIWEMNVFSDWLYLSNAMCDNISSQFNISGNKMKFGCVNSFLLFLE